VEEEDGEQGALLRTADLDPPTVVGDLERTEDPVLHPAPLRVVGRGLQPTVADPQPSRNRPATRCELMADLRRADLRRVMSMTRIWCPVAAVCAVALAAGVSPAHAAFPGTNGKIAFISDRQGDAFDVWTMNPNGQRLANLTATPYADELWPNWRPDGRKIAFISNPVTAANPEGDYELFVMGADGSHPVQLTFNGLDDERPAWSPDGSRIAFSRDFDPIEGQIDNDLFTMNADGTHERRLTNSPTVQDQEPNWSADGKTIAFVSDRDGDYEVFTMRPSGSNVRQLTFNDAQEFAPDWSPDSRMLVFAGGQDADFSIFTIRADGTRQRNLTDDAGDGWPAWAPDGRKIVFASFRDATDEDPDNAEIYTMDADGSNQVNRTENPAFDFQPDWQPLDNDRHDRQR
jgi:TolB protein